MLTDPECLYCEKHDANYNSVTDEWIEDTCESLACEYCVGRPAKPSEVNRVPRRP